MFGKWETTTKKINGSSSIVIAHTKLDGGLSDAELQGAQDIVQTARGWVSAAVTMTGGNWTAEMNAAAAACFKTGDGGPTADQRQEINRVLQLTKNGISGKTQIKLGSPTANGYVNVHGFGKGRKVKNLQTGKSERIGKSHVDRDFATNDKPRGLLTFVHESTHRYAGTVDYEQGGAGTEKGYISATSYFGGQGIRFRGPGLTTDEAITNADSYAVFVYEICTAAHSPSLI